MPALYFAQAFAEGMQAVLQSIYTGSVTKYSYRHWFKASACKI